jgi:hypothetical protein
MLATTRATTIRVLRAHHFLASGVAALVLTAVVAAGSWQLSSGGTGAATVPAAAVGATAAREPAYTFYIVTSQEQAMALQSALQMEVEMSAYIRGRGGDFGAPDVAYVEVVHDAASLDRVMQSFMALDAFRPEAGLPQATLVDLRGLGR